MGNDLADRLRAVIHYDPLTGVFTRTVRLAQRHQVGSRADFIVNSGGAKGYMRISFDSRRYLAHRVAWLYMTGEWPSKNIDHRNGNQSDNRFENLRDVSQVENSQNIHKARSDNKSGFLGASAHQGKWQARIYVRKKVIRLGRFNTPEEAHAAYLAAKRMLHLGCTI